MSNPAYPLVKHKYIHYAVSLNWKVDELLDAVQQQRSVLRDVDIMDLVLYKVGLAY